MGIVCSALWHSSPKFAIPGGQWPSIQNGLDRWKRRLAILEKGFSPTILVIHATPA